MKMNDLLEEIKQLNVGEFHAVVEFMAAMARETYTESAVDPKNADPAWEQAAAALELATSALGRVRGA
jgi:hypothetical protein